MRKNILCGIYSIINLVNGKRIIGQSKNIYGRWNLHIWQLNNHKHENLHLQNAWDKYGKENFKFEIVEICQKENLDNEEIRLIKENKTTNNKFGYNIKEGGNSPRQTEETKLKMSEVHKKIWDSKSESQKEKQLKNFSATRVKGEGNINFGRHRLKETKEKISLANAGSKRSKETKKKMSEWQIGRKMSEEAKEKMRKAKLGRKLSESHKKHMSEAMMEHAVTEETRKKISSSNTGKHHSEETKNRLREIGKRVYQEHQERIKNKISPQETTI